MPRPSLPTGRNQQPLSDAQVTRVIFMFRHLDPQAPVRYDAAQRTRFVVTEDANGDHAEITFGPDIQPGGGLLDPNSTLSVLAAAAHEICHYHRWANGNELPHGPLDHIDEALTSLEAVLRFQEKLSSFEARQLISDAINRLLLFVQAQDVVPPQPAAHGQDAPP